MKHRVSIHAMYYKIALDNESEYWAQERELCRLEDAPIGEDEIEHNNHAQIEAYEKRERAAVVAITFAAMCLEAFFFDYAADALGDSYVSEHLDKLDIKSRLLTYPKLVGVQGPKKEGQAYEYVSDLQRTRNKLVHFKSRSFDVANLTKASKYHDTLNAELKKGVEISTKAVRTVMEELDRLHQGKTNFLQRLDWSDKS